MLKKQTLVCRGTYWLPFAVTRGAHLSENRNSQVFMSRIEIKSTASHQVPRKILIFAENIAFLKFTLKSYVNILGNI